MGKTSNLLDKSGEWESQTGTKTIIFSCLYFSNGRKIETGTSTLQDFAERSVLFLHFYIISFIPTNMYLLYIQPTGWV